MELNNPPNDPDPDTDPHGTASLIHTALYDTSGEMVEGAFVDRWQRNADLACDELAAIYRTHGFSTADQARLQAALADPNAPADAAFNLLVALWPHTEALVTAMTADPLPALRAIGVRVASHFYKALPLIAALQDPHPRPRAAAVRAMLERRRTFPEFEEHLINALQDQSPEVRRLAGGAVRFYKEPIGRDALVRAFEIEGDEYVRRAIIRNLAVRTNSAGISASATDLEAGIGAGVKALLLSQINHKNAELRELVVRALQRLRGVEVATALFDQLLTEQDNSQQANSAQAKNAQNKVVRQLLFLYMGYDAIAERALPIFGELLTGDPDPLVRMRIAWLLEPFGAPAIPALIRALADATGARRAAAMTLGHIGDVRALPALSRELANPANATIYREIATAIRAILLDARPRPPIPDLTAYIQGEIDALQPKTFGDWPIRVCKEELNALPILNSILFIWALQPDGTLLCMDHEAFGHPTEPETDARIIFAALVNGARSHPRLQELIPLPPQGTEVCLACNATRFNSDEDAASPYCPHCNGLGWLLPG